MIESRLLGRSFLAVLAGYLTLALAVVLLTPVAVWLFIPAEMLKRQPPAYTQAYIVANFVYSFVAASLGGWVTARLAPKAPLPHAGALAAMMMLFAVSDIVAGGASASARNQPAWYGWAIALTGVVGALLGGWVRAHQAQGLSTAGGVSELALSAGMNDSKDA
jgi:hypothetical protein